MGLSWAQQGLTGSRHSGGTCPPSPDDLRPAASVQKTETWGTGPGGVFHAGRTLRRGWALTAREGPPATLAWACAALRPAGRREGSGRPLETWADPALAPAAPRPDSRQCWVATRAMSPVASDPARDPGRTWVHHVPPPPPSARRPGLAGRGLSDVSRDPASSAEGGPLRGEAPATPARRP